MVPLEKRADYSARIKESPKLFAFNNLLLDTAIVLPQNQTLNESDEIYFGLINGLQANEKSVFEKYYNKKSKSHPTKDSLAPFVNDDFLIFSLIAGIKKFQIDRSWIASILSLRSKSSITVTLENILNENYYSKDNLYEIVLVYFHLNNPALITNDFLTTAFKSLKNNQALLEGKSDFQILCAIRSYDLIIELKEASDGSEITLLKKFDQRFLRRMKVLTWLLQTGFMAAFLFGMIKLFNYVPAIKQFFSDYDPVLGVLGLSILGNFIPSLKRKSFELVLRIFGYPKALIK